MLQGLPNAHKALADGVLLHLHIVDLAVLFQQRQGDRQPPHSSNDQRDGQRGHLAEPHHTAAQHHAYPREDTMSIRSGVVTSPSMES